MGEENNGSATKDIIDAVKGVAEAVPIYDDMVQPAAKELSKGLVTLAKTVNLALAPLEGVVWGYEKIKNIFMPKVEQRLKNVPPENIITPKINVAGPIVEALRYTGSEEALSDLYANLLATSMDKDTATTAHPAFTEIIKQLTPDEARIIALFQGDPYMPLVDIRQQTKMKPEQGHFTLLPNYSHLGEMAGCEHPTLVPAYIDNLIRLGLMEIPSGLSYTLPGIYDQLESSETAQSIKRAIESQNSDHEIDFKRKFLIITALGKQFAKVCVVPKS